MPKLIRGEVALLLLLGLSLPFSLPACSGDITATSQNTAIVEPSLTPQATETSTRISEIEESASPISPLPSPTATESAAQLPELPTPEPGTGLIYGIVGTPSEQGRLFSVGSSIYLGTLNYTRNADGTPILPLVGLDTNSDPSVNLQVGEYFVFSNIPPGEYAFILVSPVENYVVPGDHSSGFMIVALSEGEMVDIGELPLP